LPGHPAGTVDCRVILPEQYLTFGERNLIDEVREESQMLIAEPLEERLSLGLRDQVNQLNTSGCSFQGTTPSAEQLGPTSSIRHGNSTPSDDDRLPCIQSDR
jgi:hypothetical protein